MVRVVVVTAAAARAAARAVVARAVAARAAAARAAAARTEAMAVVWMGARVAAEECRHIGEAAEAIGIEIAISAIGIESAANGAECPPSFFSSSSSSSCAARRVSGPDSTAATSAPPPPTPSFCSCCEGLLLRAAAPRLPRQLPLPSLSHQTVELVDHNSEWLGGGRRCERLLDRLAQPAEPRALMASCAVATSTPLTPTSPPPPPPPAAAAAPAVVDDEVPIDASSNSMPTLVDEAMALLISIATAASCSSSERASALRSDATPLAPPYVSSSPAA